MFLEKTPNQKKTQKNQQTNKTKKQKSRNKQHLETCLPIAYLY